MQIGNTGTFMLSLQDAVGLANMANKSTAHNQQAIEALKGSYVLPSSQLVNNEDRKASGKHLVDGSDSSTGINGLPAGKLPSHPTFSNESPYAIQGFRSAEGGNWTGSNSAGWNYSPSASQFTRNTGYNDGLARYFMNEKGNGIDTITLPNGTIIK